MEKTMKFKLFLIFFITAHTILAQTVTFLNESNKDVSIVTNTGRVERLRTSNGGITTINKFNRESTFHFKMTRCENGQEGMYTKYIFQSTQEIPFENLTEATLQGSWPLDKSIAHFTSR
jgi:hypothetical protein